MTNRELIEQLQQCDPDATVLIVEPDHDYVEYPLGAYSDLEERIDNETTFAISTREIDGHKLIEIGSIIPFV